MEKFTVKNFVRNEILCEEIFFEEMIKHGEIDYDEIENLTDTTEIFQWYRISEMLYKHLKKQNEVVYKYSDFYYFWGRSIYGQPLYEDGVIQEIFTQIFG